MAAAYQTLADIYEDVRYLAGKDSTTLEDADLLRIANKYYLPLVRELVDLNEDLYAEISTANLVANQREYVLPTDNTTSTYGGGLIKLQRVEINYTGDSTDWKVMDPISLQEIATATKLDADINSTFDESDPKYWFKDRSVWVAPVPDAAVTTGLYIYWIKRPNEMTADTAIPELPKDFLNILAEGMLIDVYRKYGRTAESKDAESKWEKGIANMREKETGIDYEQPYVFKAAKKNYK